MPSVTFMVQKKDVESGQFPIHQLVVFSKKTGAKVIVKDHCTIESGTIILKGGADV